MKRIERLYRTALLLALLGMAAGCTRDDGLDAIDPDTSAATTLTVSVSDGGYSPSPEAASAPDAPDTRTVDNGFATEFTAGDRIGLYVAEVEVSADGTPTAHKRMVHKNLCLTYNGTEWKLPDGELKHTIPAPGCEIRYYAYYPYRQSIEFEIQNRKPDGTAQDGSIANTDTEFFWKLIDLWTPQVNQSTYADYTASDLMTAQGVVTPRTGNTAGSTLSFAMQHRMNLVIIRLPHTTCNYTETIGGTSFDKSYSLYIGASFSTQLWKENHYTARYILSPKDALDVSGSFYNSDFKECKYSFGITFFFSSSSGQYKLYTIGGGAETVKADRPPQEGDFYMKDGTILPQEAFSNGTTIPPGVKEDCIGVVFWVGEKKSSDDYHYHWTYKNKSGDQLLMHEHSECIHGLVVALTDAVTDRQPWSSTGTGSLYTWLKSYEATGKKTEKDLMLNSSSYYGYNQSRRLQWYRDYGGQSTEAYNAIETFAKANPTPAGCSGWYFPGDDETTVMAFGTLGNNPVGNMTALLNTQFGKAGGSEFKTDDYYWNSTDMGASTDTAHCIEFGNNTRETRLKTNNYYVRAVLAF